MKTKKIIVGLSLATLAVVMSFVLKDVTKKIQQDKTVKYMPSFEIKSADGKFFSKDFLSKEDPSVFIAFHPECEHCQYEAKSIVEKQMRLKNTEIVLFTSANDSLTHAFSKTYGLDSLKNVHVLSDNKNEMWARFDVKTIPTIFIYNAQNQLVKRFNGETKIEAILKYIQ
jgi:thiol-disulfide isomerase/thioredoxin